MTALSVHTAIEPILHVDRNVPLLHASVASRHGALLDPPGKEGAGRLLLRLMRRTGAGKTAEAADDTVDRLGAFLGTEVGRSTSGFHGGCIARSAGDFLKFLRDSVCEASMDEAEFAQLVEESRAELLERLDDDRSLARSFWTRKVFAGHAYARSTGGTLASLNRIEPSDLRELCPKLFNVRDVRFALAGQFDASWARTTLAEFAASLPEAPDAPADPEHPKGPEGRHLVFVDKPERTQTQIVIGGLGTHPADADHTALHVGNTIFGGTFTARLTQEVRAKRGWSYGAYSSLPIDRRRQAFSMWTFPQASDAAACIRLQLELMQRWVEQGVTPRELAAAKKYLTRSHAFAVDTASKRASLQLEEALYDLPVGHHASYLTRVAEVTLDQVNEAILRRISAENLVIAVLGTHKDIGAAISQACGALASEEVVAFDVPEWG